MKLILPNDNQLDLSHPVIVGIANITPDSFSDGGRFVDPGVAVAHALQMVSEGADVIDVGGESTRPGAVPVDAAEQISRVVPVIERLAAETDVPLSIDTTRREVAEAALDAGAVILNDVSAGLDDPGMLDLAAERGAPIILMHRQGASASMQDAPRYDDVVAEICEFLIQRREVAVERHGVDPARVVLDPGIGFGKTTAHNLAILGKLERFARLGSPVMLGTSRKRFLGEIGDLAEPADRVAGTVATTVMGVMAGVQIFRVHDVAANRQAADVTAAVLRHPSS
jgi:dihydropteroate synthase